MVMVAEMIMVRRLSSFGWDKGNGRVEERERPKHTSFRVDNSINDIESD